MKPQKSLILLGVVIAVFAMTYGFMTELASARVQTPEDVTAVAAVFPVIDDFEAGVPAGLDVFSDNLDGAAGGQTEVTANTTTADLPTIPPITDTTVLSFTYDLIINDWGYAYGGFNRAFDANQDWSQYDGFSFWFYGTNTGNTIQVEILDASAGNDEFFEYNLTDDFAGWRLFEVDFSSFTFASDYQPNPDNGTLDLNAMSGYNFGIVTSPSSGTFYIDNISVYSDIASATELSVQLDSNAYTVSEGGTAVITATLSMTAASPVTVSYATADGTAVAGTHYTATSGTLVFPANTDTQTFMVETIDNLDNEPNKSLTVSLSNPISVELGTIDTAILTIQDDESGLPMIEDFENGMPSGYFADPNGEIAANVITDTTLTQFEADPNHVLSVTVTAPRAWAGLQGFNLDASVQNWSSYEGVSFWFKGTNSGQTLLYVITQDAGEGLYQASFTDDSADWKLVMLPWEAFMYREGASGTPTLSLTAVTAYFIQFSDDGGDTSFTGNLAIDQMRLFNTVDTDVYDFESGMPSDYFADPGGQIAANVITDTTLTQFGTDPNHVLSVTVTAPRAWAGLQGFNLPSAQDWSGHDGVSFWLKGTNSGQTLLYVITQDAGDGLYQASFTDDSADWKLVALPWEAFMYREGASGTPTLSLTAVTAYFIQFSDNGGDTSFTGNLAIDQMRLFDTVTTDVYDFESGMPSDYFADPGGQIAANVITDTTLTQFGAEPNHVLSVTVTAPRVWAGLQGFNLPSAQDWSNDRGVSFWFKGTNSGQTFLYVITQDAGDGLYQAPFTDDTTDWKLVMLPWEAFMYREGASGTPTLSLNAVTAYFIQFSDNGGDTSFTGTFAIDQMAVFGPDGIYYINAIANPPGQAGVDELSVQFDTGDYTVIEGDTATLTVTLNITSTEPVTVSYATADGTAVAGTHYTATSGILVFPPDTDAQTITVETIDNNDSEANKDLTVALSDPIGAVLGSVAEATLTIEDDEVIDICSIRSDVVDDFENGLATGVDGDGNSIGFFTFADPSELTTVTFTTNLVSDTDPLALPGQSGNNNLYQVDVNVQSYAGTTHAFENIPVDTWTPQDWSSYEGISFWFYGLNSGRPIGIEILDNRNPDSDTDDAERWNYTFTDDFSGWQKFEVRFDEFTRKEIGNGAPNDGFGLEEVHGWAFLSLETNDADVTYYMDDVSVCGTADLSDRPLDVEFEQARYSVNEGDTAVLTVELSKPYTETVSVHYATAESNARVDRQYTPVSGTLTFAISETVKTIEIPTFDDGKYTRDRRVTVNLYEDSVALGFQRRAVLTIVDSASADPRLVDDFEGYHPFINTDGDVSLSSITIMDSDVTAVPGQAPYEDVLNVDFDTTADPASFDRIFSQGQDWSSYDGISFWYYGSNSDDTITMQIKDNMITSTGYVDPADWELVWSDEFNDPAGTPPNPNVWQHELGDGALNGIVGWGNSESQYYTDDPANASTDGNGNLVIRLQEVDTATTDLVCWYGPCEYTSARLITQDRLDFEYGRIEARVQVPDGPSGLWPAFWMLGTDIPEVDWPQSGEIDIMEYISRRPNEVFGTIHGPGYSGGAAYGSIYDFGSPVASGYHTFTIEWAPDSIDWYVDDIHFHDAIPDDVSGDWVFNHPFFLIFNAAIGGNFGGTIDDNMTMPQDTLVDYVRVYQAVDTAERFEATFVDGFTGWQKVYLPFEDFTRSSDQPAGAPDDGLTLTEIWGYGVQLPDSTTGSFHMDRIYLESDTAPTDVAINGPMAGIIDETYTFTATVTPMTSTIPITYTWEVDDEAPVVNVVNSWQDAVDLSWAESGDHTITVTVDNGVGIVADVHEITINVPVIDVTLTGPITGTAGASYTFTATAIPLTTTTPVTYTWIVDGQAPVVQVGGTEDTLSLMWTDGGVHEIAVTVDNGFGTATTTHTITLQYGTFLPLVSKP